MWSGPNDNSVKVGQTGVALATPEKALTNWRPINERMLEAGFEHRHGKLTIIVAYAPTNLAENDKKVDFYAILQDVAGSRSPHDITLVLSDTNAALSLETPALTGRMLLAPHSSTEAPTTMANASCRPAEAQTCASLTPGFRASESTIGPGTVMMVSRKQIHRSHHLASMATMCHTVQCIPRRPTREHQSPSPVCKYTPEIEGTSLTPASPTRHIAPGGPLNQSAVPV